MKTAIVGAGYVGLVTSACLAEMGHQVICIDDNKTKISDLKKDKIPIYEPGLKELIKKNKKKKKIHFSTSIKRAVDNAEIIFIAVNTPPRQDGSADLSYVAGVAHEIAVRMKSYKVIVDKSTVPVKTGEKVAETIKRYSKKDIDFDVVSNPEFLREGSAIFDTMHPNRIVVGVTSRKAANKMKELYKTLKAPMIITDIKSAELIKHASNAFLALKISFVNALSNVCERSGANVEEVAVGMGLDKRIGKAFLKAGIGYGGSCFPKDVSAFIKIAEDLGYDFSLIKEVEKINQLQKKLFVKKITDTLWVVKNKVIGILGLAFKPNTDDMRNAPSIDIINMLKKEGAKIKVYDPQAMKTARAVLKGITYCKDPYETAKGSDALVVLTEWEEFTKLNIKKIKKLLIQPIVIDGRNIFEPIEMIEEGFIYKSVGRE
ncbi:MAG: UDP-glucose/GDP-mannose dehydrogenase family protein [Candidatus Aureabacteria bacterium]|nr:UDP-glucose/GDP-mannose dehydrogenase family protein [Candidatus Auribacterota bacterium]